MTLQEFVDRNPGWRLAATDSRDAVYESKGVWIAVEWATRRWVSGATPQEAVAKLHPWPTPGT